MTAEGTGKDDVLAQTCGFSPKNRAGERSNPKICPHMSLSPSNEDHCRCTCLEQAQRPFSVLSFLHSRDSVCRAAFMCQVGRGPGAGSRAAGSHRSSIRTMLCQPDDAVVRSWSSGALRLGTMQWVHARASRSGVPHWSPFEDKCPAWGRSGSTCRRHSHSACRQASSSSLADGAGWALSHDLSGWLQEARQRLGEGFQRSAAKWRDSGWFAASGGVVSPPEPPGILVALMTYFYQ